MRYAALCVLLFVALAADARQLMLFCQTRDGCEPPATMTYSESIPPFDGPARFGGVVKTAGNVQWLYLKVGESSRACTPAERGTPGLALGCAAGVGAPLYVLTPFRFVEVPD